MAGVPQGEWGKGHLKGNYEKYKIPKLQPQVLDNMKEDMAFRK